MTPSCPVCKTPSVFALKLDRNTILTALWKFTGTSFDQNVVKRDYEMYRCPSCTLEFAHPMIPGDDDFYNALTNIPGYYPEQREEYAVTAAQIKHSAGVNAQILDIGCGSGDFLQLLKTERFRHAIGIDLTPSSVDKAKSKGLEVYCERAEDSKRGPFDAVVSFHCLEHVEDPVGFINGALAQMKPNGSLYISTPYSPQCVEYGWYHPLNYPPHHTLRLNRKSYLKLAEVTGTQVEFVNFSNASPKSQIRAAFLFSLYGENKPMNNLNVLLRMLIHPVKTLRLRKLVMKREKINGKIAGADILVIFRRQNQKIS